MLPDIEELPPKVGESSINYCRRLEEDGYEEMYIRKALAHHFHMQVDDFGWFFNEFEKARLRHLTVLFLIAPNRSDYSFTKKVSKNLGISEELAGQWVARFRAVGEVHYVGIDILKSADFPD